VKEGSALGGLKKKSIYVAPRQQFAIFKPPEGCDVTTKMHPTEKEAEIKEYDEEPILKIQVEKLAGVGENGVNGKNEQAEPIIAVENDMNEKNGHNNHDVIDHEEEIVDVVAVSEEFAPVVPEAEEAPVHEDNGNGVREEPFLLSPRLRGSAKKGPSSSRSSSPADSLHKERTSRKLNYQPAEVPVEEKLEVSQVADLDEPLIAEGAAEDLEVSAAVPDKSPVKPRTPAKAASPGRPKKSLQLPTTPTPAPAEEPLSGRRGRKPRSDEKKKPVEDASPRASMSLLDDEEEYQPLAGRAGSAIRSVRARRPIRRSRNISALDSSLHNQSSPWDEEYKVLSPRGRNSSLVTDSSLVNGDNSPLSVSVAHKRKVSDDELDAKELKKVKNESSHTSSFFSIVTSPICALKERFRGGALSSSTPFHGSGRKPAVDSDASMLSADENVAEEPVDAKVPPVAAPEANRWCAIM